jgi:hypothetical protein
MAECPPTRSPPESAILKPTTRMNPNALADRTQELRLELNKLGPSEMFWYNHRDWLTSKGYIFRTRFQEGWTASWAGNGKIQIPDEYKDGVRHMVRELGFGVNLSLDSISTARRGNGCDPRRGRCIRDAKEN